MSALSRQLVLSPRRLVSVRQRLALVPATGRTNASRTPFVVLMVVILVGGVVGLLAFNTQMQQRSFAASKLQHRATALAAKRQQLRMELQQLDNPQHLAEAATRLGMVVPENPAFVSLQTGRVTGDPQMSTIGDRMNVRKPAATRPAGLTRPVKVVTVTAGAEGKNKSRGHGAASTKSGHRTGKKSDTHKPNH